MFLVLSGFWLVILSLIALIFIIGLIVVVHEFGHFIMARRAGITCYEFSIGMGPILYKRQFKETLFCLRAIPIGGYVSMASVELSANLTKPGDRVGLVLEDGKVTRINVDPNVYADVKGAISELNIYNDDGNGMYVTILDDDSEEVTYEIMPKATYYVSKNQSITITPYNECFDSKSLWRRFLALIAGSVMNFLLAIVLYFIYSCAVGVPNYSSNVIGEVGYGYKAYEVLEAGDKIVAINGKEVSSWEEFQIEIDAYNTAYVAYVPITIERNGERIEENLEYSIIINSLGLSNLQNDGFSYPEGLTSGAIVGNVSLRYLDENDKGEYPLSPGDVITAIKIDRYEDKNHITPGEVLPITSWQDVINALKDVDVANVYFTYYSLSKAEKDAANPYVDVSECKALQTWGNETLNNQRINKIDLKIGISPEYHFEFGGVVVQTFKEFWDDFTLIFRTLQLLIAPSGIRQVGVSDLSSVVGIFDMIMTVIVGGILPLLAFTAMLSINIGIINLLPIPALDGGRIIFLGYELVTHKKPNPKFEAILNNIFFILLLILFVYVTINDIGRLGFILI